MKRMTAFSKLLLMMLALLFTESIYAQTTGTVKGTIRDQSHAGYLPGAMVTLEGSTTRYAVTNEQGEFLIVNVPKGVYKLKITYIGYQHFGGEVTVKANSVVSKDVSLTSTTKAMQEVVIQGARFGQAKALNAQKEATNIKNVVSEEQIERFPDMNTAEVLQRVPGVNVMRSGGEGRFVGIRGVGPNMTNITVNGQLLATSNGSDRIVELDVINASQLGGLEVTKVITPDMDANAIGGSINLKSRSAFDYNKRVLSAQVGLSDNNYSNKTGFRTGLNFSDRFGAKKQIGVSFSGSFIRTDRQSNSNEQEWGARTTTAGAAIPFALRRIILRKAINERDRLGLSGQLEYKFNERHRVFGSVMFNKRWDDQIRNDLTVRVDQGKYVSETQITGARFIKSLQERTELQQANAFEFGGLHQLGKLKADYRLSYSTAYTKKPEGQLAPEFLFSGVDLNLTGLETRFPNYLVTNGKTVLDGSNYPFDVTDYRIESTTNTIKAATLDLSLPLNISKNVGELKWGAKFRSNNKDRQDNRQQWKWKGTTALKVDQFENEEMITNFQGHYDMGRVINALKFRDFFLANQSPTGFTKTDRPDVNFGEPYDASEDMTGIYLMAKQTFNKLLVLGGVRAEFMNTSYTGNELVVNNNTYVSATANTVSRSYNNIFPNLQFRYRATPNTNVRLAYTQGIAFPNFYDLVPYSIINIDPSTKSIVKGNPYLNPTNADNYDLLAEHFFKGIGIISGGVFYKNLDNFFFRSIGTQEGGTYDGYKLDLPVNGEGAKLYGFELNWQQQFTFLPGFLNGFGIFGNYTYTKSKDINLGSIKRTDVDVLPGQLSHVGNLALTYEKYGLTARFAGNFSGRYIDKIGADSQNDEWVKSFTALDFSATQRFLKNFYVFIEWNNILDEGKYTYTGIESRSRKYEFNGTSFSAGLKWSLK